MMNKELQNKRNGSRQVTLASLLLTKLNTCRGRGGIGIGAMQSVTQTKAANVIENKQ